jgi:hypothetical protein
VREIKIEDCCPIDSTGLQKRREEMEDQKESTEGRTKTGKWVARILQIAFGLLLFATMVAAIYRKYME